MKQASLFLFFTYLTGAALAKPKPVPHEVDVAIIGGGATGAYAAVRLREDYGKSVLVIEKENKLVSSPTL
jgi:heterodisulfide reductase subunit A-like polyferredoxin